MLAKWVIEKTDKSKETQKQFPNLLVPWYELPSIKVQIDGLPEKDRRRFIHIASRYEPCSIPKMVITKRLLECVRVENLSWEMNEYFKDSSYELKVEPSRWYPDNECLKSVVGYKTIDWFNGRLLRKHAKSFEMVYGPSIPQGIIATYKESLKYFHKNEIRVYCPEQRCFYCKNLNVDPLLIGSFANHHFLIAYWGL